MEAAGVLSTAFGLGLLLHASQAAFFTAINGHIKKLFLQRRRLVLLSFLLCVSIYSIFQFATLLLLEDASCGVTVRFTLFFDQTARISALALVVWTVCDKATKNTTEKVCWVVIVGLRVLLGGIIVGFTGWTFMPVCFPQPMYLVAGIVHVAFDGVCWGILLFRIVAVWALFSDQERGGKTDGKSQGYGLFLIVLSFIGWTIGSFPYLMNVGESIFVRMIPYIITLALALGVLSCFPSILPPTPTSKSDDTYSHKLHRFGSSTSSPPRRARSVSSPNFNPGDIESNKVNGFPAYGMGFDTNYNGARTSMMFRSIIGAPIVHPGTALPWSLDTDAPENVTRPKPAKAMSENRRPSIVPSHNTKPSISGPMAPILRNESFGAAEGNVETPPNNLFGKVKTVDLKTAAEVERQRIDAAFEREQERKKFQEAASGAATPIISAATPKSTTDYRNTERSTSVKRKPVVPQLPSGPAAFRVSAVRRGGSEVDSPSSLQQSVFAAAEGGSDWGMRYSTNSIETEDDDTTRYTAVSHAPYNLAAPPRIPQLEGMEDDPKIMLVNEIVYDDPALVKSIMGRTDIALTTSRYSQPVVGAVRRSPSSTTKRIPGILSPTKELDESVASSSSTPVMDRPRKKLAERGIFPSNRDSELAAQMQYNKKQLATGRAVDPPRVDTKLVPEAPVQKLIKEKKPPREMVFPIPPVRVPSVRKSAPPPITITIPTILSPEIVQKIPTPDPTKTTESIPSAKPTIPERSEKRLMSPDANYQGANITAYETAKAWVDSVSSISDKPRYAESIIEPLPSFAYDSANNISARSSTAMSEYIQNLQRRSLIALTASPLAKEDGEFTDIEIGSDSEYEDEDLEVANSGSDEQTQSEADEMIMSGGEGYSTEEESYEEYFTDSEEGYADDGVIISDIEDGARFDKIAFAERKLNAKLQGITETLPGAIPRHFQIGDRIPTFSESRRKYGSKRKPPPSPIGFLVQQRRISQQKIQARLTMFAGTQHLAPLEDIMNRLPVNQKRGTRVSYISDGRNSLIARLEMEMSQQESQWVGMQKTMARSSVGSTEETPEQRSAQPSQNLAQRRSLLAKVNSGINRRLSTINKTSSTPAVQPSAWQMQLADAQIEYLMQAPLMLKNPGEIPAKPTSILESQNTPISVISESDLGVYEDSDDESPFGTIQGKAQRRSFYQNDNSNLVMNEEGESEGLEDYDKEQDGDAYEHSDEIRPLQATVYCPSVRSTSIDSPIQSPLQVPYSSTTETESLSPSVTSPPTSLLWNPHITHKQPSPPGNKLWTYHTQIQKLSSTSPPAVGLRPKRRITFTPISKATTSLWTKTYSPQPAPHTGLWRNQKEFRPKSIITSFAPGRNRRSLKRVTFVEEVVTVEPTGFFGKLKKLWGLQKRPQSIETPTALETIKKLHAVEVPVDRILGDIAAKYATKMLPPLPPQKTFIPPKELGNTTRNPLWSPPPPIPSVTPKTQLWGPVPAQEALDIPMFTDDTSSLRKMAPRQLKLPTLSSSTLWGTQQQQQPTVASLWSDTNTGYLWPQGAGELCTPSYLWPSAPSLPVTKYLPLPVKHSRASLGPLTLESTELWGPPLVEVTKGTVVGLWSASRTVPQKSTPREINYLWPTAPLLPYSYTPTYPRSRQANAPLATITSLSLWKPSSTKIPKVTLWAPPMMNDKSMLWPKGEKEHVKVGSLWPSAPPAKKLDAVSVRSRSQAITPTTRVESIPLWAITPACEKRARSTGLWEPISTRVQATPTESNAPASTTELQAAEPKLWHKTQYPMINTTGYLWPSAPELPTPVSPMPATRACFTQGTLPSLKSKQLWSSVVEKTGLWSPSEKPTGLWPHGQAKKIVPHGHLWPHAVPLATTVTDTPPSTRSHFAPTRLSGLETKQLWTPIDVHLEVIKSGQMWEPVAAYPTTTKPAIAEPISNEKVKETPPVLLWGVPEQAPQTTVPSYLWPSAPILPPTHTTPTTRSHTPTISSPVSLSSKTLWGSELIQTPRLCSAPVRESGLWPHGTLENTTSALWPSANPLPSTVNESIRVVRFITTNLQLESSELWSAKAGSKAQLWTAPTKATGLWPRGGVVESVLGGLWPSAASLKDTTAVSRRARQRSPITPAALESHALWNSNAKPSLWAHPAKQSGLWPQGTFPMAKKQLWGAGTSVPIDRRSNLTLRMAVEEKRVRHAGRRATMVGVASGALWSRPEEMRPKVAGWLLSGKIEATDKLKVSPVSASELQVKDGVALPSPGLWANPPLSTNISSPVVALWMRSPLEAPRAKFTICREILVHRKRPGRDSNSRLSPVQGKLWVARASSLLPKVGSHTDTWTKKRAQEGLWNAGGSTITLAQLSEKKSLLWDRHSKDRKAVFAHLSLNSQDSKQKRCTTGRSLTTLKSDHLWTPVKHAVHHHSSGLWHMVTKPAQQTLLTLSPRERTFVTPRTPSLWQKCDKPLQPASVVPAVSSRSNKRAASNILPPLFLARVGGPMWTADKLRESRPRGLWRQTEIPGTKGLWEFNNNALTDSTGTKKVTAATKNSKLWGFPTIKQEPIFSNLPAESTRRPITTTTTRKSAITAIPMEGPLWGKSRPNLSPARPKLWRKEEKSRGLWAVDGNANSTMTLVKTMAPTTMHLWGGDNVNATPIFADLSLESSRSRREFTAKTFSTPPEGLWKKQEISELLVVAEHSSSGLWGTTTSRTKDIAMIDEDIPAKVQFTLWQKGNAATSIFADLPIESFRSKKDHSTITLPVFSEGMWKRKVALPERPQLWKPAPKATGLWDTAAKTKTLAQISLERKAKGTKKPLWSKDRASRTTTKVPQRSPLVNVRISDDPALPKATGSLWKPKKAAHQPPQLWTTPKPTTKPAKPIGTLLWAQGHGSKTTTAVPERTKVAFIPPSTPLPKVSGSLWKPKSEAKPPGLWKRPINTVAIETIPASTPLWAAHTASRTTAVTPQYLRAVPKKKDSRSISLLPATGSLWQPLNRSSIKGLWKAPAPPSRRPRRASLLWAAHSASRTTTATPVRTTVPKRLTEAPLQAVSGTLWKRPSPQPQKGLWKRTIPTVATFRKTSISTLWTRESASRTTSAKPERAPFVPKPISEKSLVLPPVTGELWAPSSAVPQTITLWSRPTTPSGGSGVWDAYGRTPSLAEMKFALATKHDKTVLWQRRSVLTSKAATIDISKITPSSVPQKKVKVADSSPAQPVADGSLWRPCVDGKDEQGIMWITRSSRSSSLESEFISPGVSRASTISDMSDESELSPTTREGDGFEPRVVRVHSTKVSVSSAVGESLWRPSGSGEEKIKERGLWSSDGAVGNRRSVLVTERPARIALPSQREQELPMWDRSHSLWGQPPIDEKALWTRRNSDTCSSVSDEDFASAASEFSEESHYEDFEPSPYELDHFSSNQPSSSSSSPHVFVGQFRRDNYLLYQQPNTQLPENSPFASSLRIRSLRRKLRPTTNTPAGGRKRRNTEGEEEREGLRVESMPMERAVSMGEEWQN